MYNKVKNNLILNKEFYGELFKEFGSSYFYKEQKNIFSTTANSYQSVDILETPALIQGFYRLSWFYVWSSDSTFSSQILLDGLDNVFEQDYKNINNIKNSESGMQKIFLNNGEHSFFFKIKSENIGKSVNIYSVKMELFRIN